MRKSQKGKLKFDGKHKSDWKVRATLFAKRRVTETVDERNKRVKHLSETLPRVATLDGLRQLQYVLDVGTCEGLEVYRNRPHLDEFVDPLTLELKVALRDKFLGLPYPRCLGVAADEDSSQVSMGCFLKYKLQLNYQQMRDEFHRSSICTMSAIAKAGQMTTLFNSIARNNVSYGPYQHSTFFLNMQDQASALASMMDPSDPILVRLWPRIYLDKLSGTDVAEHSAEESRRFCYQDFGDQPCFREERASCFPEPILFLDGELRLQRHADQYKVGVPRGIDDEQGLERLTCFFARL